MNPDVPSRAPIAPPVPDPMSSNWFERQCHSVAEAGKDLMTRLDPTVTLVEEHAKVFAADVWRESAGFVAAYGERNKAELSATSATAIIAFLQTLAPGLAVEAVALQPFITSECEKMFSVLDSELQAQAAKAVPAPTKATP